MSSQFQRTISPFDVTDALTRLRPAGPAQLRVALTPLDKEISHYLDHVMAGLAVGVNSKLAGGDALAEEVYAILTDRHFCHLSRGRAAPYRERTLHLLDASLRRGGPIPFWYDIGPGYHASIRPGQLAPNFDVGLSELLVLVQIANFCNRVAEIHSAGARFSLVVDNICAYRTNDIPLERTALYCAKFRELICETGMQEKVEIFVESEAFDIQQFDELLAQQQERPLVAPPSPSDVENVARFIGRACSEAEAALRIDKYRRTSVVTEHLLAGIVQGVRIAQRASDDTLGFRPFPGGDSRTQCGEVAIGRNSKGNLHPILLTSHNIDSHDYTRFKFPDLLPSMIHHVSYAAPRST